jgi:uroporphyrinogen decarboxylase
LQLFDSWAGLALGLQDYVRYIQPYNMLLFAELEKANVPTINFSTGTALYLDEVAACGGSVIGVDWRIPLDLAWEKVGVDRAVQGNLDPTVLLTDWEIVKEKVDDVLGRVNGRLGHIFNLGHGIFPNVPTDTVKRLVAYVQETTQQ